MRKALYVAYPTLNNQVIWICICGREAHYFCKEIQIYCRVVHLFYLRPPGRVVLYYFLLLRRATFWQCCCSLPPSKIHALLLMRPDLMQMRLRLAAKREREKSLIQKIACDKGRAGPAAMGTCVTSSSKRFLKLASQSLFKFCPHTPPRCEFQCHKATLQTFACG